MTSDTVTFDDLKFEPHQSGLGGTQARHDFPNGYGVSVITGAMFYTSDEGPYEVAVFHDGEITYDTPITDDVLGYQSETDVIDIMRRVAALPAKAA